MSTTNPKPFSAEEFLAFVKGKPRREKYRGTDASQCALAQFGFPDVTDPDEIGVTLDFYTGTICQPPFAFGALADRLESALAEAR